MDAVGSLWVAEESGVERVVDVEIGASVTVVVVVVDDDGYIVVV